MDQEAPSAHWTTTAHRDEVWDWCSEALGPVFGRITGMQQTKLRPWSSIWRVETVETGFYFKVNCPAQAFEAGVVAELGALAPDQVVPVVALDRVTGFLLTPDQGPVLAESGGDDLDVWCRVAREGALLQRAVLPGIGRLEAAGLTRLVPADAEEYLTDLIDRWARLDSADPRHLAVDDAARLSRLLPELRRWVDRVSELGLPITLNHNDLHEHNVFDVDGRLRFFDFGDALLTEPLQVLLIPLNLLRDRLDCGPDDPRLVDVAGAALEVWSDLAPLADLRAALPAALQLGRLGRCESWARVTAQMSPSELGQYGDAAAAWLLSLLEDPPLC
ncbi:conserved hypothetical protein [metagenome]|uniref:Uncharacterized protein n=1 Tax=metagenome TaxID=256318 RepID=A0A2P2BXC0_9ZZZZ